MTMRGGHYAAAAIWLAGLALVTAPMAAQAGPACFASADNARLSFQVIQNAPAPAAAAAAGATPGRPGPYAYYPLTGIASMQLRSVITAPAGISAHYFQWANRSNAPLTNGQGASVARKANLQPALAGKRKQRTTFTSVARANGCTLAQTASILGLPEQARRFAGAAAIVLVSEDDQADQPPLGPPDTCVIPAGQLPPGRAGVLLDYEVQDGRSVADTTAFLQQWADLVHGAGRPSILLINPLDAPTQRYTGISAANAHTLVNRFDLTTILLWNKNPEHSLPASYQAQKAVIAAGGAFDGSRVLIDFELAGTTLDDAKFVRRTILADRLAGVFFWRNGAKVGGDCRSAINARIAAIALGHDDAHGAARWPS
ncbi:hypothetical protein [Novosphingobium sp.]|uniref:hypothetical protein n=1 Tax=Novosphingobium sp. TaxID=1874826 RepID=UPI003340CC81